MLCLDERILQMIYQHLSLVDQVCLSLSCKELFGRFGTIAKHKDLEFPRLLCIRNPILCVNSQHVSRNQLLLRLENRSWAYSGRCLKLHPRKEFTKHSLRQPSLERFCTCYAGIADLCPCISLTIRGREQLVKILKSPPNPAKTKYSPFEHNFGEHRQPMLSHACLFSTRSGYDARAVLVVLLNQTGQSCVTAWYTLIFTSPNAHFWAEPFFVCPHRDLISSVPKNKVAESSHRYIRTFKSSKPHQDVLYLVPENHVLEACTICPTLITKDALSEEKPKQAVSRWFEIWEAVNGLQTILLINVVLLEHCF